MDISKLQSRELLKLHSQIEDLLRQRGIKRTSNNPTGDLAEYLFCRAFKWNQAGNSHANVDATHKGKSYQIKGRRITSRNKSRQLSAIRDLAKGHFDYLAAVLFTEDYSIAKAALIPSAVIKKRARFVKRTNSHKFILRDQIWKMPGVKDVTKRLQAVRF